MYVSCAERSVLAFPTTLWPPFREGDNQKKD
jgi:hypothetical protein